jgi:hypothetical protein
MKYACSLLLAIAFIWSCKNDQKSADQTDLDQLARSYVSLGLYIGQYDEAFVDAYYGPDSLKPVGVKATVFPKDSLIAAVTTLRDALAKHIQSDTDSVVQQRAGWIDDQLIAFERRIRIYSGETGTFDAESKELFGAAAPTYDTTYFAERINTLDAILDGEGDISVRFQALANRFIIPKEKLDTVFKAAIAECRKKTLQYYTLPAEEDFQLEFVTDKSWSGYNWYKGNYQSLIQINTDIDIFIDRALDVGSHESYPGHHVYNMLLEEKLFRGNGLTEISLYPLFSPQSLIAEGTANYGIDMAFPGDEKIRFSKEVLLPLAGLDTTGITQYFRAIEIKGQLNYIRNEVGRQLLAGTLTDTAAVQTLMQYGLYNEETAAKSVSFIRNYRSYVINYNYGLDLVRQYVDMRMAGSTDEAKRWAVFSELLSRQVRIRELTK